MSRATVELDFFGMEKDAVSSKPRFFNRQKSFRDIQSAISKINPKVLKSVIASGSVNQQILENGSHFDSKISSSSVPSTPKEEQTPLLPLFSPSLPRPVSENSPQTAPLTIFYNGAVAVFNVPRDKAETILKLAENGISKSGESTNQKHLLETFDGDLPIARRKSLQRFLEKRRERLTLASPYGCPASEF